MLNQVLKNSRPAKTSAYTSSGLGLWTRDDATKASTLLNAACIAADSLEACAIDASLFPHIDCYFRCNAGLHGWESLFANLELGRALRQAEDLQVRAARSQKQSHRAELKHIASEVWKHLDGYRGVVNHQQALLRLAHDAAAAMMHPNLVQALVLALETRSTEALAALGKLEKIAQEERPRCLKEKRPPVNKLSA